MSSKVCNQCFVEKPLDEFYKEPRNKKDGRGVKCAECSRANAKIKPWKKNNPAYVPWFKKNDTIRSIR